MLAPDPSAAYDALRNATSICAADESSRASPYRPPEMVGVCVCVTVALGESERAYTDGGIGSTTSAVDETEANV